MGTSIKEKMHFFFFYLCSIFFAIFFSSKINWFNTYPAFKSQLSAERIAGIAMYCLSPHVPHSCDGHLLHRGVKDFLGLLLYCLSYPFPSYFLLLLILQSNKTHKILSS